MGRFDGKYSVILIADKCTYKIIKSVLDGFSSKICDKYTRRCAKIKCISRMYKFDDFYNALDCMHALQNQSVKLLECRLYAAKSRCYMLMKTNLSQRAAADKIALEFGERLNRKAYPIIAERAALISNDFYADCAKIKG
ncbi:MAG: hypothetical protein ACI396_00330 [Acutalibacteraceae bacterium]